MENIAHATADNICFYMAINQINKDAVAHVCRTARKCGYFFVAEYSSMTRDNFLGFGCSATSLTIRFTERQRMIYYLFWMAYSTKVDSRDFETFFGKPLQKIIDKMWGIMRKEAFPEKIEL